MMNTRKYRAKRLRLSDDEFVVDYDEASVSSSHNDPTDLEEARKSRIRDSNKEFAKRMTILQSWSEYWNDYTTRDGDAYPIQEARDIMKRAKKIKCPITSCGKSFTSIGGLKYHYARCNIERSFKCKVCNPQTQLATRGELLKHMILRHYEELPDLNEEQKEIVNSYRSCETRVDKLKKGRKVDDETETPLIGQNLVNAYRNLHRRVFFSKNFVNRPYKDWHASLRDWEPITNDFDRRQYYPPESESVRIKLTTTGEWVAVKTGESIILKTDKRGSTVSSIFFTGGTNTAIAWLPKPLYDDQARTSPDIVAVAVNSCSMDQSTSYKDSRDGEGCVQFWTVKNQGDAKNFKLNCSLSYMVGHSYGTVLDMHWCPLGASWQDANNSGDISRIGLLALACGDGKIRILSVPHTNDLLSKTPGNILSDNTIDKTPMYRVTPVAILLPPGVGPSTDYQTSACKSICWCLENNQRLIASGYSNGSIALFDIANNSPLLYSVQEGSHVYQPLKSWFGHGAPVTGIAISSFTLDRTMIASGSIDRQLKIWNPMDLSTCLTFDRAPITNIRWDFRFRGLVTATDTAFTSFNNRVSYRYPVMEGSHNVTVSLHRSTVWGLDNSIITSAIAAGDGAGELFVLPQLISRSLHKRDRNILSTHSLYTMLPHALSDQDRISVAHSDPTRLEPSPDENGPTNTNASENKEVEKIITDLSGHNLTVKIEENGANEEENTGDENGIEAEGNYPTLERPIANQPTKFLLPIEHRPVESYEDFKKDFGIEFTHYNFTANPPANKLPESCSRAGDIKNIYCDRPCDYPFSSINLVAWSPNVGSFSHLISATQSGFCRLDRVQIIEQIYRSYIDSIIISDTDDKQ